MKKETLSTSSEVIELPENTMNKNRSILRIVILIVIVSSICYVIIMSNPYGCIAEIQPEKLKKTAHSFLGENTTLEKPEFRKLYKVYDLRNPIQKTRKVEKILKKVKTRKIWSKGFYRGLKHEPYLAPMIKEIPLEEKILHFFFIKFMILSEKLKDKKKLEAIFFQLLLNFKSKGVRKDLLSTILNLKGGSYRSFFGIFFLKIRNLLSYIKENKKQLYQNFKANIYKNRYFFTSLIILILFYIRLSFKYYSLLQKFNNKDDLYDNLNVAHRYLLHDYHDSLTYGEQLKKEISEQHQKSKAGIEVCQVMLQKAKDLTKSLKKENLEIVEELKELYKNAGICMSWEREENNFKMLNEAINSLNKYFNTFDTAHLDHTIYTLSKIQLLGPNIMILIKELKKFEKLINSYNFNCKELNALSELFKNEFKLSC